MIVVPLGTGSITDLSTLLFDRGRSNLEVCRLILRDVHRGIAALCLGGGNAVAMAVER